MCLRSHPTNISVVEYLKKLMSITEQVARGDTSIILPALPQTLASMTSQLDKELASDVVGRHSSRFVLASERSLPEPIAGPSAHPDPTQPAAAITQSAQASSSAVEVTRKRKKKPQALCFTCAC